MENLSSSNNFINETEKINQLINENLKNGYKEFFYNEKIASETIVSLIIEDEKDGKYDNLKHLMQTLMKPNNTFNRAETKTIIYHSLSLCINQNDLMSLEIILENTKSLNILNGFKKANFNFSCHILYEAIEKAENFEICKLLIKHGAKINSPEAKKTGQSIISYAINSDYDAFFRVKFCLDNGANVNFKNADGVTPLHWAGFNQNMEIFRLLLEYGANPLSQIDYNKKKPFEYSSSEKFNRQAQKICDIFIEKKALEGLQKIPHHSSKPLKL